MMRAFIEALAILAVSLALGTAVHLLRTDEKRKIAFVGKQYTGDCRTIRAPTQPDRAPTQPASEGQGPAAPAPDGPVPIVHTTVFTFSPPGSPVRPPPAPEAKPPADPPGEKPPPAGGGEPKKAPVPLPEGVREITFEEALQFHKDEMVFLDARRTRFYEQGHLPRARPFSVWEADLDRKISDLMKEHPDDMPLVIYCSSGDCEDSHMLAGKLKLAGFKDLMVFKGGYPEWVKQNQQVEKGEGAGEAPAGGETEKEEGK